jgi:hypothetical protein
MAAITILDADERGILKVGPADVMRLLGANAINSRWEIGGLECTGGTASDLHTLSDSHRRVSGMELLTLLDGLIQVIDGRFSAFRGTDKDPWLEIVVVDSSAVDVVTNDPVLATIAGSFERVHPIP